MPRPPPHVCTAPAPARPADCSRSTPTLPSPTHLTAGAVTSAPAHTAEDAAEIAAMQAMTMTGDAPKQIRIRAAADATATLQAAGGAPLKDRFWDCSCTKTGTTKTPAGTSPWACTCSLAQDSAPAPQQQPAAPVKAEQPKPAETKPAAPQQQPKADAPKPAAPKAEAPKVVKAVVVQAPKPVEKKEAPKPQEKPAPKPQEAPLKEAPKPAPAAEQPKAVAPPQQPAPVVPQQPAPVVQQPAPVVQQPQPAQEQFPEENLATETPAAGKRIITPGAGSGPHLDPENEVARGGNQPHAVCGDRGGEGCR